MQCCCQLKNLLCSDFDFTVPFLSSCLYISIMLFTNENPQIVIHFFTSFAEHLLLPSSFSS